jgi:septal ring factor EnvC (AmiA/AmiB activator)
MPEENTPAIDDGSAISAPAAGDDPANSSGSSIDNLDDALKQIEKLRRENAKHRTEKNKLKEGADRWQEHLDAQKTELEKSQADNATLAEKLAKYERERLQRDIASDAGLDPDLAEFILGDDEASMKASAKKLAEKYPAEPTVSTTQTGLLGGQRGEPVVPKKTGGGAFLEHLADAGSTTTTVSS